MRLLLLSILFTGCLGPVTELWPEEKAERPIPVYVISHGWHVGLAVHSEYMTPRLPAHPELPEGRYLKFGWGDRTYYPHEDPGIGHLLQAAFLPTRSVMHVVGIDIRVESYFRNSTVIRVQISKEGMKRLAAYICSYLRTTKEGSLIYRNEGLYGNSAFFEAHGYYFFPKTSNTWTARALRKTGAPISPFYAVTSGNVIRQTRSFGEVLPHNSF